MGARLGTCNPVLGEMYYGIDLSASRMYNLQLLRSHLNYFTIWPFDHVAAEEYGRLFAELQRIGRPMQQIDVMIAAIALTLGNTTVVSADADLLAVPGLSVENWATP